MHIEKSKLPKGMGYPLKSSVLQKALEEANVDIFTTLTISPFGCLLDAHFWPENRDFNYDRLYVRSGAVKSAKVREAKAYMENIVVPDLMSWLSEKLVLDYKSTKRYQDNVFLYRYPRGFV